MTRRSDPDRPADRPGAREPDAGVRPEPVAPSPAGKDATSPIGRRLGQLLVADEVITAVQLGQALAEQTRTNEKLGGVLVLVLLLRPQGIFGRTT